MGGKTGGNEQKQTLKHDRQTDGQQCGTKQGETNRNRPSLCDRLTDSSAGKKRGKRTETDPRCALKRNLLVSLQKMVDIAHAVKLTEGEVACIMVRKRKNTTQKDASRGIEKTNATRTSQCLQSEWVRNVGLKRRNTIRTPQWSEMMNTNTHRNVQKEARTNMREKAKLLCLKNSRTERRRRALPTNRQHA